MASNYVSEIVSDISECVKGMACQPILFIGSGLSKRYINAPSWDELLSFLAQKCPLITKDYAYYKQTYTTPLAIGQEFAKLYQEWAWSSGKSEFPEHLFSDTVPKDAYIKFKISEHLDSMLPSSIDKIDSAFQKEIIALQSIRPHAIITTNYDRLLEIVFPEYQPIIGQQIISGASISVGEIFKIHGCTSLPENIVFTQSDYDLFTKKKKYLSAKLLTYFSEHPLLFIGYSANDPNIRAILSDIDEALPVSGGVIPNVYIVEWKNLPNPKEVPAKEKLIGIEESKSVRIKAIQADNFEWVFSAFSSQGPLGAVSPRILRALLSRSYDLVRHDIPRKTVQANFQMLEHAVENQEQFAALFGLTTISNPSLISAQYPHTLSDLAKHLNGGKKSYWYKAQELIDSIKAKTGFDIKSSDNEYHCAIKYGSGNPLHKYSDSALVLLKKTKKGENYEIKK